MNYLLVTGLLATGLCLWPARLVAQTAADLPAPSSAGVLSSAPIEPTIPPMPNAPIELQIQSNRPLKLQEAIDVALERSPQLQLARLAVDRSEAIERQAASVLLPTLGFVLDYTYIQSANSKITQNLFSQPPSQATVDEALEAQQASEDLLATQFTPAQVDALSQVLFTQTGTTTVTRAFQIEQAPIDGRFNFNYNVFSGGVNQARILSAGQQLEASRFDYERIRQDVINGVIIAYYDLQTANGNLDIGDSSLRSADAILKDAQAQERAGVGTRFAVLQADVQRANAEQQLLQYQNDRTIRGRDLARLLNFERPTEVSAEDPIEKVSDFSPQLDNDIFKAYNQRPELRQQIALEQAAKAQEAAAYGSVSPQLGVFFTGQAVDNLLDAVVGIYTGYSAGVRIQWNAFDGGLASAQADQAIADAKSARVRYVDTLNSIRFAVESSYSTLNTANRRIDTTSRAVTSAEESLRLARLRFQAGVGTQTDVLVADRDLTQARVNRLTAIIDYNRGLASLRRALGIL